MNEDLKWLAENVHEWDDRFDRVAHDVEYPEWFNAEYFDDSKPGHTRAQWQAARDELSGKPGWDDVDGQWIAQDKDGQWYSYDNEPYHGNECWDDNPCYREEYGRGQVLGDWRNTLERRPMSVKQAFEKMRQIGGFDVEKSLAYTNCDAPTEWRGPEDGLPHIGSTVELRGSESSGGGVSGFTPIHNYAGEEVKIYSHFTDDRGVELAAYVGVKKGIGGVGVGRAFKPLRTEEDKAVEEMVAIRKAHHWTDEEFCRELYARGYRKQESK